MIKLQNISKVYTKNDSVEVKALQEVTLDIKRGEFVAVVGPSGSGKSTLMNLLGLLDRPTEGTYFLENEEVNKQNGDDLAEIRNRKIGFVFQSFHLLPRISAIENVELPLIYSDKSDFSSLARKALKAVDLEDRMNHHPSELSGGEQQRVAIARALVNEPDILLADEPTGNLDSQSGLEVMRIFKDLHSKGKTIVLITHDPYLAEFADRIIRIVDGRITSDNPLTKPKNALKEFAKLPAEKYGQVGEKKNLIEGESQ